MSCLIKFTKVLNKSVMKGYATVFLTVSDTYKYFSTIIIDINGDDNS